MISSNVNRIGSIGASDTRYVMMNWNTKTFGKWWNEKLGIFPREEFSNVYMDTGTMLEVPVIEKINEIDGLNIKLGEDPFVSLEYERLKVNLDGYTDDTIYEIKCVGYDKAFAWQFKLDKYYYQQCQVQMYAAEYNKCFLVAYGLEPHEYDFEYWISPDIQYDRIFKYPVKYDVKFINDYKKKLAYLCKCFETKEYPTIYGLKKICSYES